MAEGILAHLGYSAAVTATQGEQTSIILHFFHAYKKLIFKKMHYI